MGTSRFTRARAGTLDGITTTTNYDTLLDVGLLFAGASKTILRRGVITFNIFGAPSAGRPLQADDVITAAQLELNAAAVIGTTGHACTIARITRDDWDEATATYDIYKTANNWTTPGGDIDATTPTPVAYNSPGGTGLQTMTGLSGLVTDAKDLRSGRLHIRLKMDSEVNDGVSRLTNYTEVTAALVVTYDDTYTAEMRERRDWSQARRGIERTI